MENLVQSVPVDTMCPPCIFSGPLLQPLASSSLYICIPVLDASVSSEFINKCQCYSSSGIRIVYMSKRDIPCLTDEVMLWVLSFSFVLNSLLAIILIKVDVWFID